ncbi:hypothetical protein [Candidatus Endoriftia persephonae]|uniref:Uncharacterized protein n=2 Tax=Gammaproteobacteria TaxID=1236 RepID=G2FE51_9GAMM|nr:hypothetical protein [Candidatus Endoriftia persephone]EGW55035.1 hypothetical protein TevJSym_ag01130 [endosymbiont of Tevnia jerichonana (vent Tica)]USF87814.1 rRNA methyltransferase [Candidatus Endoriftia persephone]
MLAVGIEITEEEVIAGSLEAEQKILPLAQADQLQQLTPGAAVLQNAVVLFGFDQNSLPPQTKHNPLLSI